MDLPFELHIALRYLLAKRKQAFISVISLISTLGVTVGVMALVIALALMTGLQGEIRDRILGANPHIYVWKTSGIADYRAESDRLRQLPHVVGAAPAILGKAMVSSVRSPDFVNLTGIDPTLEASVSDLKSALQTGTLDALNPSGDDSAGGILLGKDLARNLGVAVGDSVSVVTPEGTLSPMGMIPRARRLRVAGTFSLGLYELDTSTGFVALDVAKRLFGKEQADLIQLRVDDILAAPEIARSITTRLGDQYLATDWTEMNRSFFQALALEKIAMSLTIGLIMMVAALNIVGVPDPARHGETPRHRDSEDDGRQREERDRDLRHAGRDHRHHRHRRRRDRGLRPGVDPRSVQADQDSDGRVSGVARSLQGAAVRPGDGRPGRGPRLPRRDDLPVTSGGAPRSRAGAEI